MLTGVTTLKSNYYKLVRNKVGALKVCREYRIGFLKGAFNMDG